MIKIFFTILFALGSFYLSHGQKHFYESDLPLAKITNDSIYTILDRVIHCSTECNELHDSTFIIIAHPLTGYYRIAGLMIFRAEESYRSWMRAKSKVCFAYKGFQFIVVCEFEEFFRPHSGGSWGFVITDEYKRVSFNILESSEVYEDSEEEVVHKLCWWYLYDLHAKRFKLTSYYDCFGNYYNYSPLFGR